MVKYAHAHREFFLVIVSLLILCNKSIYDYGDRPMYKELNSGQKV